MPSVLLGAPPSSDPLVDELTRRGMLAGGLGVAALLGLPSCAAPPGTRPRPPGRRVRTRLESGPLTSASLADYSARA